MRIIYLISAVLFPVMFSSCLGDLDTVPLNETDFTADRAYGTPESYKQGLAKIYGSFVLVGSSSGTADIDAPDAGASELNRSFWCLQEICTDACKNAWTDSWVTEINTNTWTAAKNAAIFTAYNRIMMTVSYVNEYLRQTEPGVLDGRGTSAELAADIRVYRDEARFIRAYAYWMGLDLFGKMPFVTENDKPGAFFPPEYSAVELFDYIESELVALSGDSNLKEPRENLYPRIDKTAAWALLARLYLNAEVYAKTARYADAKTAAAAAIGVGYTLADSYRAMFMGDNGKNPDVLKEMIFAIAYDGTNTKSYGGTSFLINAAIPGADSEGKNMIFSDGWGGNRIAVEYVNANFEVTTMDFPTGTFVSPDRRAIFRIAARQGGIDDLNDIFQGVAVMKFSNRGFISELNEAAGTFSSTDYPMIRLAEVYLIYAEATLRAAGGTSSTDPESLKYLNELGERAYGTGHVPISGFSLDYLLKERARELMWEGHRRTDLIRFGNFLSGLYVWPWKGGVKEGAALNSRFALYPLPTEDLVQNPNLSQNPGY